MKYRLVIKDLRQPTGEQHVVVVGDSMGLEEADQMQKRFAKLKWNHRRPGILTIDHVALVVEQMP